MIRHHATRGQALLESALLLPLLLVLVSGGYWIHRHFSFTGSAESASQAHLLRSGRSLPSISPRLAETVCRDDRAVLLRNETETGGSPWIPFRALAGKTKVSLEVSVPADTVEGYSGLPAHRLRRTSACAVDCWGKETKSGGAVRTAVRGTVLAGAIR